MGEELITYNNMWFGAHDEDRWIVEEEEFEDKIPFTFKNGIQKRRILRIKK